MSPTVIVLSLSILLQLSAAWLAWPSKPGSGLRRPGPWIVAAAVLLALRGGLTLLRELTPASPATADLVAEFVVLAGSALLLVALASSRSAPKQPPPASAAQPVVAVDMEKAAERTRVEQASLPASQLLQTMFDTIPDAVICTDRNLNIVSCNHAVERILGYAPEELLGQSYTLIIAEEMLADPEQPGRQQALYEQGFLDQQAYRFKKKSGETFTASFSVGLWRDESGVVVGQIGTIRDISAQVRSEQALINTSERLRILHDIERAILAADSLDDIARAALARIRKVIPSLRVTITLFDFETSRGLILAANAPGETALDANQRFPLESFGGNLEKLRQGEANYIRDSRALAPDTEVVRRLQREGLRAYLNIPLMVQDELIGSLNLGADHPDAYQESHIEIAQEVANSISVAIHNHRLLEAERQQRVQAETLQEMSGVLNASLDLEEVLSLILQQLRQVVVYDSASIMLRTERGLEIFAQHGFRHETEQRALELDDLEHIQTILEQHIPVVISDTQQDPRWRQLPDGEYIRCWVGVPLRVQNRVIGILNLDNDTPGSYSQLEIDLIQTFSNQAAAAIQNARLYEQSQQEILDRKRTEEALRVSQERYSRAVRAGRVGVWDWNLETDEVFLAPNLKAMLGYQDHEIDNRMDEWMRHMHADDRERAGEAAQAHLNGLTPVFEVEQRMLHKDGSQRWFIARGTAVRGANGDPVRMAGTSTDITALKQAEGNLVKFKLGIERSREAVFITDLDGTIIYANPAFEDIYGFPLEETLGKTPRILKSGLLPPEAYEQFWQQLLSKEVVSGELINKTRDGRLIHVEGSANPLLDEKGEIIGFLAIQRDITHRKQGEREKEAIIQVASAMRTASTRAEMLPVILDQVQELLGASGSALTLGDPDTRSLRVAMANGVWEQATGQPLESNEGLPAWVISSGQPAVANGDGRAPGAVFGHAVASSACVPLIAQNQAIGSLCVGREKAIQEDEVRLLAAIADMAANALQRASLHEQTERRLQQVQALRTIDQAITVSVDLTLTLDVLLDQLTAQLGVDAAAVLLLNPFTQTLEYAAGRGIRFHRLRGVQVPLGDELAGEVTIERRPIIHPDLSVAQLRSSMLPLLEAEGIVAYHGLPLVSKAQIQGVLEIYHRRPLNPDPEWQEFLESLATQAAIAIDNAQLFQDLQRSNQELILAYDTTLEGWSRALELRDQETQGHAERVNDLTLRLARSVGIPDEDLVHVRRGALLHDIGKMAIPDSILFKPGPLSDDEWDIMRQHPVYAQQLLAPIPFLRPALDIPYCHHEKWDGSGYPRGLQGEAIPLAARVFAVVDVWDALRSDRPYRPAWSEARALQYLREQAGAHFDPHVVAAFLEMLEAEYEQD